MNSSKDQAEKDVRSEENPNAARTSSLLWWRAVRLKYYLIKSDAGVVDPFAFYVDAGIYILHAPKEKSGGISMAIPPAYFSTLIYYWCRKRSGLKVS